MVQVGRFCLTCCDFPRLFAVQAMHEDGPRRPTRAGVPSVRALPARALVRELWLPEHFNPNRPCFKPNTHAHTHLHTDTPTRLHTFTPSCLHTFTASHLHTHTPTHLHTQTPTHLHTHTTHARMSMHEHAHARVHARTCTHGLARMRTHTHTIT